MLGQFRIGNDGGFFGRPQSDKGNVVSKGNEFLDTIVHHGIAGAWRGRINHAAAMSATAVIAVKPDPVQVVSGGATLVDTFNVPNRSISVSMFANEDTQSEHLTLQAIEDGSPFHSGFEADITC